MMGWCWIEWTSSEFLGLGFNKVAVIEFLPSKLF